jgi:hypothetical protein
MARFNEILVGRYNRSLQKLLGIKGEAPAPQLSSEIVPAHNFFSGVENRLLESWTLWGITIKIVANAGNVDTFQLRMPSATNVLAVIEKLTVTSTNANIEMLVGTKAQAADLTTTLASITRDTRQLATTGSTGIASWTSVTVPGPNAFYNSGAQAAAALSEVVLTENQEIVISPGFCLQVQTLTANVAMIVSIFWRERALEEGERS